MWGDIPEWTHNIAKSVMKSVYAKDPDTFYHCMRVSHLSRLLAVAAGLSDYHSRDRKSVV